MLRYTKEFKAQAVDLVRHGKPVQEVAQELEVGRNLIYKWIQKETPNAPTRQRRSRDRTARSYTFRPLTIQPRPFLDLPSVQCSLLLARNSDMFKTRLNTILTALVALSLCTNNIQAADAKPDAKKAKKADPKAAPAKKAEDKKTATKKAEAKDPATKKAATKKRKNRKKKGAPALLVAANHQVSIPKDAFGKEYLMSASLIPQSEAPTSTGLAGKIVRFELFHDGVDIYESTQGLVVTDELPAKRLITSFPIVKQDDKAVIIDFNKGMRRVFSEIWYGMSTRFSARDRDSVAELPQSRVFSVTRDRDQLVIRQSAQVRDRRFNPNEEGRYEIRYFFAPYTGKKSGGKEHTKRESRYVRFFETQGQLEKTSGRAVSKIALFDLKKPLQFYWSANTPKDYVQAMKDGILYWNRAFGKEIIKAGPAPKKITAPDSRHNIVQWVPWDSAGFAYADILVDPRTGESRHGQAYMTSVFAVSSKARARALIRSLREQAKKAEEKEGDDKEHRHSMFPSSKVCRVDHSIWAKELAGGLEDMLANGDVTDAAVLRASQDYVREVVAHEVGHVLGLRHNFAGSLAATMNHKELDEFFKAYLKGENLEKYKDKLSGHSMMEYTAFKGSVFVGWKMRATDSVLPHDKAAIQWGYQDKQDVKEQKMFFGTDDDVGKYGDLNRFDYGVEPVLGAYSEISAYLGNLPNSVIETFIRAKAPVDPRDAVDLKTVNLSPGATASTIASDYRDILKWYRASTRSLRLENKFDFIGDLNRRERVKAHWDSLNGQLTKLGGVDNALFAYLPTTLKLENKPVDKSIVAAQKIDAKKLAERLEKLLNSPAYSEFVGLDEKKYKFTDDEKKLIVERGKNYFEELEKALIRQILSAFERATRDIGFEATRELGEKDAVAQLEKRIGDLARAVIIAKGTKKIEGRLSKTAVTITDFKYDHATRLGAARALTDRIGSYRSWSKDAKADIHAKLKAEIDGQLNIPNLKTFHESNLSRPLRQWFLKQSEILALLPARKAPPPRK